MMLRRYHLTSLHIVKVAHSVSSMWETHYISSPIIPVLNRSTMSTTQRRNHQTCSEDSNNHKKSVGLVKDQNELATAGPMVTPSKFKIFHEEDSPVILDVEEERELKAIGITNLHEIQITDDEFSGLNMKRGSNGVFGIEELIELLKKDKAQDLFVASLPSELKYVDFIVVVTGRSARHMLAMAEFIRKAFKKKMHSSDIIPRIEGETSKDWIALDLGNIALHVFSKAARKTYDLDSLWGVGSKYDDLYNKPEDPLITLLERHSVYLGDLQPNETNA